MTYTNEELGALVERLNNLVILDEVRSDNRLGKETADAIEALMKERDNWKHEFKAAYKREEGARQELSALRKQIDELQPVAWHFSGKPLYLLEGIKK